MWIGGATHFSENLAQFPNDRDPHSRRLLAGNKQQKPSGKQPPAVPCSFYRGVPSMSLVFVNSRRRSVSGMPLQIVGIPMLVVFHAVLAANGSFSGYLNGSTRAWPAAR